jgi:Tol biopolymer transport system component
MFGDAHPYLKIMTHRPNVGIVSLLLLGMLSACGGDSTAPPTTGTLEINVVTTGADIDADGYLLSIDGGVPQAITANGTLAVNSPPGTHTLAISGVAFNCDVTSAPTSAGIALGKTTQLGVAASCTPYLRNAIIYTTQVGCCGQIVVLRPDGSRREQITSDQAAYSGPAVSPDGQSIAVASAAVAGGSEGIFLLDRFGKGRTKVVFRSTADAAPAWSPDGTKLAFRSFISGPYGSYGRIFIVNRDGSGLRQLTPETTDYTFDEGPSWSPDGARLVFSRNGAVSLINADGTGLVSTGVQGSYPAWSPDGARIAFESINGGNDGIFVMDMTFTPTRLTTPIQSDQMPRWSPDGQQLVFGRVEGGAFHIYKIRADGSEATKLSATTQGDSWASWSPNF